jgi:VanZ family protein
LTGRASGPMSVSPWHWAIMGWLILVAIWLTWTPFSVAPPRFDFRFLPRRDPVELSGNLLLLLPFGAVVGLMARGRPILTATVVAAVFSFALESGQTMLPARLAALSDLMLNTAGATLGAVIALRLRLRWGTPRICWGIFSIMSGALLGYTVYAGFIFWSGLRLEDWDPAFSVAVGTEIDGHSRYTGQITDAVICAGSGPQQTCVTEGASAETRARLVELVEATQTVDVRARVVSAFEWQSGPARIITFSGGAAVRNIALAQAASTLIFRVRTPLLGLDGSYFELWFPNMVHEKIPANLHFRFDHGRVRGTITTPAGTRTETFRFGPLSAGILLRGPGRLEPLEVSRSRSALLLILGLSGGIAFIGASRLASQVLRGGLQTKN